jgi:hypothetical protein
VDLVLEPDPSVNSFGQINIVCTSPGDIIIGGSCDVDGPAIHVVTNRLVIPDGGTPSWQCYGVNTSSAGQGNLYANAICVHAQ